MGLDWLKKVDESLFRKFSRIIFYFTLLFGVLGIKHLMIATKDITTSDVLKRLASLKKEATFRDLKGEYFQFLSQT